MISYTESSIYVSVGVGIVTYISLKIYEKTMYIINLAKMLKKCDIQGKR